MLQFKEYIINRKRKTNIIDEDALRKKGDYIIKSGKPLIFKKKKIKKVSDLISKGNFNKKEEVDFSWEEDALRFYKNWINNVIKPINMDCEKTNQQFEAAMEGCRDIFVKKLHDYGAAWRIMRPESVTDQIYIKANRVRGVQVKGHAEVDEDIAGDFQAIVNYSIVGLIQLELGYGEESDVTKDEAVALYDKYAAEALALMKRKNHDYDEAWRSMRISSYTDLILMKVFRTKQIEDLKGQTLVSEGIGANYMDMLNYSVFALIKLDEQG